MEHDKILIIIADISAYTCAQFLRDHALWVTFCSELDSLLNEAELEVGSQNKEVIKTTLVPKVCTMLLKYLYAGFCADHQPVIDPDTLTITWNTLGGRLQDVFANIRAYINIKSIKFRNKHLNGIINDVWTSFSVSKLRAKNVMRVIKALHDVGVKYFCLQEVSEHLLELLQEYFPYITPDLNTDKRAVFATFEAPVHLECQELYVPTPDASMSNIICVYETHVIVTFHVPYAWGINAIVFLEALVPFLIDFLEKGKYTQSNIILAGDFNASQPLLNNNIKIIWSNQQQISHIDLNGLTGVDAIVQFPHLRSDKDLYPLNNFNEWYAHQCCY